MRRGSRGIAMRGGSLGALFALLLLSTPVLLTSATPTHPSAPQDRSVASHSPMSVAGKSASPSPTTLPRTGGMDGPSSRILSGLFRLGTPGPIPSPLPGREASGPVSPLPASTSTTSNFYVNGSECGFDERATQLGRSSSSLASLVYSTFGLYNGSTAGRPCIPTGVSVSPFFYSHGALEVARSLDSGRSWTDSWPNSATDWYGNGTLNNSVFDGLGGIASDEGVTVDSSTVLVAGSYAGSCLVFLELVSGYFPSGCTADVLLNTTTGAAIGRSTDGAQSWGNATVLSQRPAFTFVTGICGGGFYRSNITGEPSIALNPVNLHAVAVWDNYEQGINATSCNLTKVNVTAYRSVSVDGGVHWSTPALLAPQSLTSRPTVSIGPSPTYAISVVMNDDTNGTLATKLHQADHSLLFTRSTDNGTTWSAPADIAAHAVGNISGGVSNTNLQFPQYPTIATDNWSGSAYRGNLYVAFGNNETGGINFGYPGISIAVRKSGNLSWTPPVVISDPTRARTLWDPAVAVSSDGTVWVTFVAVGVYSGFYQELGVDSRDGGAHWSGLFPVADSSSVPGYVQGVSVSSLLYNFGLVGTSNGTYAGWTDCRVTNCTSTFDVRAYMAQLFPVRLTTDAPSIVLKETTYGVLENLTLSSGVFLEEGWASGALHSLVAPISAASNVSGTIEAFEGFSGLFASNNSSIAFATTGAGSLLVQYRTAAPAYLTGTVQPNLPYIQLSVTARGGVPYPVVLTTLNPTTLQFNTTLPSGPYTYSVTGGFRYIPVLNQSLVEIAGAATVVDVVLMKSLGSLFGTVTVPGGARVSDTTVTVNGTPLPLNASGGFSTPVPWGYYWVNATNPTTVPYAPVDPVVVNPGSSSSVPIHLGGGWVEGLVDVTPGPIANLVITVNGSTLGVRITGGVYNWSGTSGGSAPGGWYWINATQPGYNTTRQYVHVQPGITTILNLHLSTSAVIFGQIRPLAVLENIRNDSLSVQFLNVSAGAVYYASGYSLVSGEFNVTVKGGFSYRVLATARGYAPINTTVAELPAGSVSPMLLLQFTPLPVNCTAPGGCSSSPGIPGYPWTIVLAAVGVVALAGIAYYLSRRRGPPGTGPSESEPEDPSVYGERPLSELPKLTPESPASSSTGPDPPSES